MKNITFIFILLVFFFSFSYNVNAEEMNYQTYSFAEDNSNQEQEQACEGVFGDLNDPNSIAFMFQQAFDFIKFLDVVLVLGLTIVEFMKAITAGDDALKKAVKTTSKRLIAGVIIFFVPTILNFIFDIAGFYGTCGIG